MIDTAIAPHAWLALALAWLAALAAPGPDIFLLVRLAARGRRRALLAVLGIMTGNTAWTLIALFGLGGLIALAPWLLGALQGVGASVLIILGVQAAVAGARGLRGVRVVGRDADGGRAYLLGLITNLSNPKALVFFTALFTQLLPPEVTAQDRIALLTLIVALGFAWFAPLAVLCSASRFRVGLLRAGPALDIAGGSVFILVGGSMLVELLLVK